MGSKKTTTQTQNSTNTNAPPTWTLPGLQIAGNAVTEALRANEGGAQYGGDFVAQADQDRVATQIGLYDNASNTAGQLAQSSQDYVQNFFAPRDDNMLLQEAITASLDPVYRNLQERVLPGITNSALMAGAYSNDRALGVVPGEAIRDTQEEAARLAASMGYAGYQAEQDRQIQRAGMLPTLTNLIGSLTGAQADLYGMGTAFGQQNTQTGLDNDIARHQYGVSAPYERIAPAAQLLAMLSQNWGTQTGNSESTTTQRTSGLGPILQGAMGIASMAAGLGAFGPMAGAAGAAGSGAAAAAPAMVQPWPTASNVFGRG